MPVSVTLNLVAVVALAVQLKIFIYLYLSNRVRFFRYLVWAWGCYVGSKMFEVARYFVPGAPALVETTVCLGTIGDFLILASALALRWNYSIRWLHVLPVAVYALYVAHYGCGGWICRMLHGFRDLLGRPQVTILRTGG
jgi:hypothetical protein